jgi:hypothetical protein
MTVQIEAWRNFHIQGVSGGIVNILGGCKKVKVKVTL